MGSTSAPTNRSLFFGPFTLLPNQGLLLDGGKPVRLASRALEILIALADRPGELVTKRELMQAVWPDTTVVEANLTVHVTALRRALGDGQGGNRYIVNIPGRGYRFVAPIAFEAATPKSVSSVIRPKRSQNLPHQMTRLIGRTDIVEFLVQQQRMDRLLAIVGPAGIGKTALALNVAEELVDQFKDGISFVDLAPISDPNLVATALASVLDLEIRSDNPLPGLMAALAGRTMLLVLDNCEHLIDEVATLATGILTGTGGVSILATSREPLNVPGEHVYQLSPLQCPPAFGSLDAAAALNYAAVQLFVERAAATMNDFELSDADALRVAEICRRLDGIPLAIEFAAARVSAFGISGVATRLDDRLRLLKTGRRGTPRRQQTIRAALDWSFELLSEEEQIVLRRLAVFSGGFTLEAAVAVASDTDVHLPDVADRIASLVMKSLISAEVGHGDMRFRLLETTRAYALEKLTDSEALNSVAHRHAEYFRLLLENTGAGQPAEFVNYPDTTRALEIGNIRAALAWAFGPSGDDGIAIGLAAAAVGTWLEMSFLTECLNWTGNALDRLGAVDRGSFREMVLQYAYGFSSMFSLGINSRARAALVKASELAEALEAFDYQLRALATLIIDRHRLEDFRGALILARRAEVTAAKIGTQNAHSTANSALGASLFFLGDYAAASPHLRKAHRAISVVAKNPRGATYLTRDRCVYAHVLWLQGFIDQAVQAVAETLVNAQSLGRALVLCRALVWCGCDMSVRLGNLTNAEHSIARLKRVAEEHSLSTYYPCAVAYEGIIAHKRGDLDGAERLLRAGLDGLRGRQSRTRLYTPFLSSLAEILALKGDCEESLALADEAVRRTENNNGFWWMPEALRIKGEVLALAGGSDKIEAERQFRTSIASAKQQGAPSWELRAATSLCRLHNRQNRSDDARGLLNSVYRKFAGGFDTYDLRTARAILDGWTAIDRAS